MLLPLTILAFGASCGATASTVTRAMTDDESPREFGDIDWGRQLEPALLKSATAKKPVMLLFQEVPG